MQNEKPETYTVYEYYIRKPMRRLVVDLQDFWHKMVIRTTGRWYCEYHDCWHGRRVVRHTLYSGSPNHFYYACSLGINKQRHGGKSTDGNTNE